MSAHETVEEQLDSRSFFASSMSSKPRTVRFGPASFSDDLVLVVSISMDASQP